MKKFFVLFFVLSFLFTFNKVFAFSGSGSGTLTDPYQITSCTQLQEVNSSLSSAYILNNNIDCSETLTWNSGAGFAPLTIFTGNFNGNGYKITGLYINRTTTSHIGLFGEIGTTTARVKIDNLGLENINIKGGLGVGGLVGYIKNAEVSNSYTTGTVLGSGSDSTGGLVGYISSSYSSTIFNSYSRANVTGKSRVGGAIGYPAGIITNVYSTGIVAGTSSPISYIGGLSGIVGGTFISSYWDTQSSGTTTSGAGIGKTTEQMKSTSTYETWNFNKIWSIDPNGIINDGYPYLNVFNNWADTYHSEILSGSGTLIDPYTITTCNQLQNIKDNLSAYYKLGNNIDCSSYSYAGNWKGFYPLGISTTPFTGSFNGNGYKITGLYMNYPYSDGVGLFGYVGPTSVSTTTIQNFGLENIDITGKSYVGGVVGYLKSGNISNVYNTGEIKQIDASNADSIGGIIGVMSSSYNAAISNSYSTVNVIGKSRVGGAVGSASKVVTNIYSTGLIKILSSPSYIGGLTGVVNQLTLVNSYWDTQSSGTTTSAAGTGKTTAEMQDQSTFTGWDFTDIWVMNGYPVLRVMSNLLTYTAGSNGSITGTTTQSVSTGGSGTEVIAIPNTGYHFVSWSDGVLTASRTDTNVLNNASYTASFAINTYTVNYSTGENGSITGDTSQTINYNGFASEVTAVPNTGYHFTSWSDGVLTASRTDVNITGNISVTASFEIDTHTLTYTAGSHGTISGSSTQIVNYGSNGLQVEAVPDEDYRFVE